MALNNRTRLFLNSLEILADQTRALLPALNTEVETGEPASADFGENFQAWDDALILAIRARNEYANETDYDVCDGKLEWVTRNSTLTHKLPDVSAYGTGE